MTAPITSQQAEALLYREALLIDTRAYDEWLTLFTPDIEFWMPAWRDETTPTQDPESELSLIYYKGIRNLQDRIERLRSGLSTASSPPPRCSHSVTNVQVLANTAQQARVAAVFTCHRFEPRMNRQSCFFGRYDYTLRVVDGGWKIARKTIILLNDTIPTMIDIDCI